MNPAPEEEIGRILADEAVNRIGEHGEVGVLADAGPGLFEASRAGVSQRRKVLALTAVPGGNDDADRAFRLTRDLVRACPSVGLVVAFSPSAMSGGEAVLLSGRQRVKVIGVGEPVSGRRYLENGVAPLLIHWSARDLGYLTVYAAAFAGRHRPDPGADSIPAGRLGRRELCGGEIVLGQPIVERSRYP